MIDFKEGDEYAWIEEIGLGWPKISFVKIEKLDRNFYTKELMIAFSNHPYWFDNEFYNYSTVEYELNRNTTLIKVENEQHKLAIRLKYE